MNDMSSVIIPKSDQINADSLIAGPMTVRIKDVHISGGSEQPVSIALEGTDLFYRPCKSMSRVLVTAWGADAKAYIGRSLTLYRDPEVKWGGLAVGGIRISHMSHIDGAKVMVLTATKGSRKPHKVLPLVDAPKAETKDDVAAKWAGGYIAKLAALETIVALDAFANEKAGKLAELQTKRPELHGQVMDALAKRRGELVPADDFADDDMTAPPAKSPLDDPEFAKSIADIAAAPDIAAIDALDQKTDAHRVFLTDAQCDRLDEALALKRAELNSPAEASA